MVGHTNVLVQRLGCICLERPKPVDPFVARDRGQPRPERPRGIVGMTFFVNGYQDVLNRIFGHGGGETPTVISTQPKRRLREQNPVSVCVSGLRGSHHPVPVSPGVIAGTRGSYRGHIEPARQKGGNGTRHDDLVWLAPKPTFGASSSLVTLSDGKASVS